MRRVLPIALCVWLAVGPVSATVVVPAAFSQIVADAALIVRGTVTDVRAIVTAEGVESIATVAVQAVLKGDGAAFVSVRVPGGTIGRYRRVMVGAPTLRAGQQAVFFLSRGVDFGWRPIALSSGIARVEQDAASRRAVVRTPMLVSPSSGARRVARGNTSPLAVDEFEALVRLVLTSRRTAAGRPQ
jgi:autotransporter translocation and assembly factor TamB